MKNLHTLFFILFLFSNSFIYSQNHKPDETTGLPNDLDSKYTPDNTSLFNSSTDALVSHGGERSDIKNTITYDVALLGRSTVGFFYERYLNHFLTAQIGIGSVIAKDQIQQVFIPAGVDVFGNQSTQYNATNASSLSLSDLLKNSTSSNPGIFLSGGLKVYFTGDAPEGVFFKLGVTYAVQNLNFNATNSNYYNYPYLGSPNISVQNLNFNFLWGYQFSAGVGKVKFINTISAGFGIKRISYTNMVEYQSVYNGNTGAYSQPYLQASGNNSVVVPAMIVGYALGIGW